MKLFAILLLAIGLSALAYEVPIGVIVSADGGSFNNLSKYYFQAGCPLTDGGFYSDGGPAPGLDAGTCSYWDGGQVFNVPGGSTVDVQCNLVACIGVGDAGAATTVTCQMGAPNTGVTINGYDKPFPVQLGSWNLPAIAIASPDGGAPWCQIFHPVGGGFYSTVKKPAFKKK